MLRLMQDLRDTPPLGADIDAAEKAVQGALVTTPERFPPELTIHLWTVLRCLRELRRRLDPMDGPSEREAELQLALADLINQANQAAFWLQKTSPEGQKCHAALKETAEQARRTLARR